MPFSICFGILLICSFALVPLFGYNTTPPPAFGISYTGAIITILVLFLAHAKLKDTQLPGKIRIHLMRILKRKIIYILIGYIIFLFVFYYLLADYIILDI